MSRPIGTAAKWRPAGCSAGDKRAPFNWSEQAARIQGATLIRPKLGRPIRRSRPARVKLDSGAKGRARATCVRVAWGLIGRQFIDSQLGHLLQAVRVTQLLTLRFRRPGAKAMIAQLAIRLLAPPPSVALRPLDGFQRGQPAARYASQPANWPHWCDSCMRTERASRSRNLLTWPRSANKPGGCLFARLVASANRAASWALWWTIIFPFGTNNQPAAAA